MEFAVVCQVGRAGRRAARLQQNGARGATRPTLTTHFHCAKPSADLETGPMQKIFGVLCIVGGVLLLVWGHNVSLSLNSQINEVFTGEPSSKATYLYIGGAILEAVGLFAIFFSQK